MRHRMAAALGVGKYTLRGVVLAVRKKRRAVRGWDGEERTKERECALHSGAIAPPRGGEVEGIVVAAKTWQLCGDRKCVMRIRKVLVRFVEIGLATRLGRRGLYLISKGDVDETVEALRFLICSL